MTRPTIEELTKHETRLKKLAEAGDLTLSPSDCLARLPEAYFSEFETAVVADHVYVLCTLTTDAPFAVQVTGERPDSNVEVTVFSFDVEGMLGLLTGVLGVSDFDIQSGSVYTLTREVRPPADTAANRRRYGARLRKAAKKTDLPSRRIVDRFVGRVPEGLDVNRLRDSLTESLSRLLPDMLPGRDREAARRMVNEAVANRLRSGEVAGSGGLFPVELTLEGNGPTTKMTIVGEDTPFFLYSLSTALTLQGVSIEAVQISTEEHVIRDVLEIADRGGAAITDSERLDRIRLSVLLTKQFTYFLGGAPDPYAALVRFETLSQEIVSATEKQGLAGVLSQPLILKELARLLGASEFLWEDFIRGQYENLLPMLSSSGAGFSTPQQNIQSKLKKALDGAGSTEEKKAALNEFKDTEAYLIDLDHILRSERDFFFLSDRLSLLADCVVTAALEIAWSPMCDRYGIPQTVAGLPADYAVFGLGKLGGRAIGYASDLELLFIYGDNGVTDGISSVTNAEFFERFLAETAACIESKREGIFQVDLRLRPYGNAGPHAVSLESFNRYYGREGDAHSYEKLALTRLRFVAGDAVLGKRIEQLRDELVYGSDSISLADVRELRHRQFQEKASGDRLNAKFSPGGLVDLEYGLQILLVQHGRANPRLRTASLHVGLDELAKAGVVDAEESSRLVRAYRFLRNLINGLRMLRGNAQDLFLPDALSLEYAHLARRMGYTEEEGLSAADQLRIEFQARTAAVRAFLEHHLGHESIPGKPAVTAADIVLTDTLSDELIESITSPAGLNNSRRAVVNLRSLAGTGEQRDVFSELVGLAWSSLSSSSDPDMALNNWDRYVSAVADPVHHYKSLLHQPAKLGLMLNVLSASQFLAEILIGTPAFLEWALDKSVVGVERNDEQMFTDLQNELTDDQDRQAVIRWFRQREILRIGTRDICLGTDIETITREISAVAVAVVRAELEQLWTAMDVPENIRGRFCLLAFGKLGGYELNYSSDIDLLGVYEDEGATSETAEVLAKVQEKLRDDLSSRTAQGHAFRVDFRLRPHGSSGALVQSSRAVSKYYRESAAAWEHQALIKLGPIAGNLAVGAALLEAVKPSWVARWSPEVVIESISRMRSEAVRQSQRWGDDIKSGEGSIRDIEFTVQGLQMIHAAEHPQILTGNTFEAIRRLVGADILDEDTAAEFAGNYGLLRRVEHLLQILEDRQVHHLPDDEEHRRALARRIAGPGGDAVAALKDLDRRRTWIRNAYDQFLVSGTVKRGKKEPETDKNGT